MNNINTLFPGPPLFIIKNDLVSSSLPKMAISKDALDAFVILAGVSFGVVLWVEYHRTL
jgi:hypothetical protein